jgi:hypothetical protein
VTRVEYATRLSDGLVLGDDALVPDGHRESTEVYNVTVLSVVFVNMCLPELQIRLPVRYAIRRWLKPYLELSLLLIPTRSDIDAFG